MLTSEGRIFSRYGLSGENLMGCSWKELNLKPDENLHLVWISCGVDVAWGCDANGQIYITTRNSSSKTDSFGSVWSEVEGQPKDGTRFAKVKKHYAQDVFGVHTSRSEGTLYSIG